MRQASANKVLPSASPAVEFIEGRDAIGAGDYCLAVDRE
jgi:hypothetical protein